MKKYKVFDSEAGWYRFCDTLTEAAEETDNHIAETDGDCTIAWRVFDAQFWGVPQRRRRIALVADFGGESAPEILFERESVSRHTPPSRTPWETFAAALAERFGGTNTARENGTAAGFNGWKSVTGSIQYQEERAPTIEANMPPNVVEKTYCIQGNCIDRADTAGCNGRGGTEGVSYTLNTVDRPAVYDARGNVDGQTSPTITGDHNNRVTDYTALCVRERCGCEGGGKGLLVQEEKSGTLAANNIRITTKPKLSGSHV